MTSRSDKAGHSPIWPRCSSKLALPGAGRNVNWPTAWVQGEQQVQRYEATGYRSASLARISDVADAVNLTITEEAHLQDPDAA